MLCLCCEIHQQCHQFEEQFEFNSLHVFGDHSLCSEDWCGYIKDPENYKPRNLPYSKYLTGEDLLKDLKALFSLFSNTSEKHWKHPK